MQDVEQNMDELFRKAADHYPLKKGDSNWEDIALELSANSAVPGGSRKKINIRKTGTLLLLLLLFLAAMEFFTKYTGQKDKRPGFNNITEKNRISNPVKDESNDNNGQVLNYKMQNRQQENNINIVTKKNSLAPDFNSVFENKKIGNSQTTTRTKENIRFQNTLTEKLGKDDKNSMIGETDSTSNTTKMIIPDNLLYSDKKIEIANVVEHTKSTDVQNSHIQQNRRGFYLGAVFGPSFSEVKYQGLRKPGFDVGIVAGYRVNKKILLETGLLFAQKYYFSDGKYFSMDKVRSSMPAGMKVLSLEGKSTVFEVPIKIKYYVLQKNRTSIFSSAGISSYIMTGEKNNYRTLINGSQQNMISSYNGTSGYFAVSVDLSIGYEKRIGKSSGISIEPYLQIPLKGMGVGALPVISTGLRIGFNRFIH